MPSFTSSLARAATLALSVLTAGCASFSPDGGLDAVRQLTQARTGVTPGLTPQAGRPETDAAQRRSADLLQAPLSADSAIELAFLNNAGLQASWSEVGIAEADLVRAGRLRNPVFNFSRIGAQGAHEIDRAFVLDVLGLLMLPLTRELEGQHFAQVQTQAALDAVQLAGQVRQAWVKAVAAQQALRYHEQVHESASASAELAGRMVRAGNLPALAHLREQSFQSEEWVQLMRARQQARVERERLTRLLGLPDPKAFVLPERLPDLPTALLPLAQAEQTAMDQRLDLRMAKRSLEGTARALGLSRSTGLINVLEAGYRTKQATGERTQSGFDLQLELPLFDFAQTRVARAEAVYRQAMQRTVHLASEARSQVREAHAVYEGSHGQARHLRDEVVPLRQRISEQNLLRYNGMFISVFELLADSREQVASVTGYLDAQRDFWLADAQLQQALCGGAP